MSKLIHITLISLCALTTNLNASETKPLVYVNKNVGFNIEGYGYKQPALPCELDNKLVNLLVEKGNRSNMNLEAVETIDKVKNGTIPVVLMDIDQLVLGEDHVYGKSANSNLPRIQITAGLLKGTDIQTAKHTCAIASTSDEAVLPTDKITYYIPAGAVCEAVQKCLEDLSKDVITWIKPQVK